MQQQTNQAALISSTQRPIPLRARPDLEIEEIEYRGVPFPVVKDPVGLQYYRLQPEQHATLNLLDGERSLRDVRDQLLRSFPTLHITPRDVQRLVTDLHEKGLLSSDRLGQGEQLQKKHRKEQLKKIRKTCMNPLYLRLPGWDPERTLQRIEPWFGWIFTKPAASLLMLFVAASWLFLAIRFGEIRQRLPEFQQFFGWPNLIYLWLTMGIAKVIHEFGHGIACKHFGAECHSMGVMLLVFSPTLYCDVTDSWMIKNKWKRIIIGAAGMYVEVILAAVAIFIWYNTNPGLLNHLALNVFFISTVTTVIFNANPLLRYDGYYMMSDWLEIPNLRSKAFKDALGDDRLVGVWNRGSGRPVHADLGQTLVCPVCHRICAVSMVCLVCDHDLSLYGPQTVSITESGSDAGGQFVVDNGDWDGCELVQDDRSTEAGSDQSRKSHRHQCGARHCDLRRAVHPFSMV